MKARICPSGKLLCFKKCQRNRDSAWRTITKCDWQLDISCWQSCSPRLTFWEDLQGDLQPGASRTSSCRPYGLAGPLRCSAWWSRWSFWTSNLRPHRCFRELTDRAGDSIWKSGEGDQRRPDHKNMVKVCLKAYSHYCIFRVCLRQTFAFLQRDWNFSISALTQSTTENADCCGKCESALRVI